MMKNPILNRYSSSRTCDRMKGYTENIPDRAYRKKYILTCEILKHYQGHLEIDSNPNSGTTIKLFIPYRSGA
jgi:hypothetical protein